MLKTPIHFNKIQIEYGFTPEEYYEELLKPKYNQEPYTKCSLNEDMTAVHVHMMFATNPCYIMDHAAKRAYVFIDEHYQLQTVTHDDIVWDSLQGLGVEVVKRARGLHVFYPFSIGSFCEGVAMVTWQLQRDGGYYDNGYACSYRGDKEINIYGFIDKQCRVVIPFQFVKDCNELLQLQLQAVKINKQRNPK